MDTVLLLVFVSTLSLIAAVVFFGSRSRNTGTTKPKRSSNKAPRRSTGGRNKAKQKKPARKSKSPYAMNDDELHEMFIDTMLGSRNKDR
jgi:hypothetical protein